METKEIYRCEPFRVWVESNGCLAMKLQGKETMYLSADIAAILGACLVEGAAHVVKETAKCVSVAGKAIIKDKEAVAEAAEIADHFTKLE